MNRIQSEKNNQCIFRGNTVLMILVYVDLSQLNPDNV